MHIKAGRLFTSLLAIFLTLTRVASAQAAEDSEWEYLVVSYGTTYFSDPLLDPDAANATFSKVQLFSEIGVTLPQEAVTLQRNIDVLGMFGWEMVTIVGSIGGDQQIVFKRPYDAERSAAEAERIKAERQELIDLYEATSSRSNTDEATERPQLIDLDAVERAQATEDRNRRDEGTVRGWIEAAAATGFMLPDLVVVGRARSPDSSPEVSVTITLDVTEAALVGPGQYRRSLATTAINNLFETLLTTGFVAPPIYSSFCFSDPVGEASITVNAVIQHGGVTTTVATNYKTYCFE